MASRRLQKRIELEAAEKLGTPAKKKATKKAVKKPAAKKKAAKKK